MIEPRIRSEAPYVDTLGPDAVEFARAHGIGLFEWQQEPLNGGLGVRDDGRFAHLETAVNCARQNGKNEIALVRELYGLFVLGERLVIHSAHEFKTSSEHQRRVEEVVQESPDLLKRVKGGLRGFKHAHGQEGFELKSGERIRFLTRTKGGGRGHVGDLVVLDEAMILPAAMMGALFPTMAARSKVGNPQMWYFFTAVDRLIMEHGQHVARLRARARADETDPSLAYFEWSVPVEHPDEVTDEQLHDPEFWAVANPSMDLLIAREFVANELRSLERRTFIVERLGGGDYPRTDGDPSVLAPDMWDDLEDERSTALDPVAFAFDVTPARSSGAIAAAGSRPDGLAHVEVVAQGRGTGWIVDRLLELQAHRPVGVFCAAGSPAESLVPACEREGLDVTVLSAKEHALACGMLFDGVEQRTVRHRRDDALRAAVAGAVKRDLGESWAWSRRNSAVDISPLCAVTFALYGHATSAPKVLEPMVGFA